MSEISVEKALQLARKHHQAGQLPQAEALYRQILQTQPDHANALHLLGVIAYQVGRHEAAVELIRQAIALKPNFPEAYSNLCVVLKDQGLLDEAIAACRQAIALQPNYPEAYTNLGNALQANGQFAEAIAACRQAIALMPHQPQAYNNLGNALKDADQLAEAIAAYRQALALNPAYPEAHNNLGQALQAQGRFDEAIAAMRQAIALKADYPEAYSNLGVALQTKGQLDEAVAAFRQALALKPNFPEALSNLGHALKAQGHLDAAVGACRQAIALNPRFPEAYGNLGNALADQGQLDEALAAYRQAVALAPANAGLASSLVYTLHFHPAYDAQSIAAENRHWNLTHAAPLRSSIGPHANDRTPDRPLRVGYVSPDFRGHVVGINMRPLFQHMDRAQFETFCYADVAVPDQLTEEFRRQSTVFRVVTGMTHEALAAQIRTDRIDILVDLALHMAGNRLLVLARKPAPVQATFAGYPGSTGLETIDYRLTDPYLDPPAGADREATCGEEPLRLPSTFWCYDALDDAPPTVAPLPALTHGYVTFGCLNNFCKVNEGVLKLWAKVMAGVPGSRLVMLAEEGSHRERTLAALEGRGVSRQRMRFSAKLPRRQYLELYHQIDIGLDTVPYNGHTTSMDSFYMGVPVVTLVGKTVVGRAGLSQLMNLGMAELIGRTEEQFVEIARGLAADVGRLASLRAALRARMQSSPLMDGPAFARGIEAAYRRMWRRWCAAAR